MKILMYDAKQYDIDSFESKLKEKNYNIKFDYVESDIDSKNVRLAEGYDGVCCFVNSPIDCYILNELKRFNIKLILLRCAGYNNIDLNRCRLDDFIILRVPKYSPEAVAEMAITLALSVNRRIHKAYIKVRENNFSLNGLMGINFNNKTAGIIGTGKIGAAMAKICKAFNMNILAYDLYKNEELDFVKYVSLDTLYKESDLISLHCPLLKDNYHMINKASINKMKDGVILINTSRGGLINTEDLIYGIREKKFFGVGLDVYEEEEENVFENREDDILEHSTTARLLSFPNVIVTSHQGFFTKEALDSIADTTIENANDFLKGKIKQENMVKL